jgi:hypothetical protein
VAEPLKTCVPGAIRLECGAVSVVLVSIHLDDQAAIPPEEVDLVSVDSLIDLRLGKVVAATESEEEPLELAAGEIPLAQA